MAADSCVLLAKNVLSQYFLPTFTKTIILLALMVSELIAHSASGVMAIDSETIRARGIIGYYFLNSPLLRSRSGPESRNGTGRSM